MLGLPECHVETVAKIICKANDARPSARVSVDGKDVPMWRLYIPFAEEAIKAGAVAYNHQPLPF